MKIQLDPGAKMPTKAYDTDAGYDLYAMEQQLVPAKGSAVFNTGVHIELPKGTAAVIISKSGLNILSDITSTGLVDAGYTGAIRVKLYNHGERDLWIYKHEKISQFMIVPLVNEKLEVTDSIDGGERGDNGFGSTGRS